MKHILLIFAALALSTSAFARGKNYTRSGSSTCKAKQDYLKKDCKFKTKTKERLSGEVYECGKGILHSFYISKSPKKTTCEESFFRKGTRISKTLRELPDGTVTETEEFIDPQGKPRFVINGNGGYLRISSNGEGEFYSKGSDKSLKLTQQETQNAQRLLPLGHNPFAGPGFAYPKSKHPVTSVSQSQ